MKKLIFNYKTLTRQNICLIICLLLTSSVVHAQTLKGSCIIGGGLSLSYRDAGIINLGYATTIINFSFGPNALYFPINRLAIGLNTGFSATNIKFSSTTDAFEQNSQSYSLGPIARYYVPLNRSAIFIEGSHKKIWNWQRSFSRLNTVETHVRFSSVAYTFGVGFTYFVRDSIGIETLIKYNSDISDFLSSNALAISLGLQFYLFTNRLKS